MYTTKAIVPLVLLSCALVQAIQGDHPALWFEQNLDHFDYENQKTWNQRYFQTDQYYKGGGPAFLSIGGEGPANPIWLDFGHWTDIAKDVGAMCFILEHRFYGESHPTVDTNVNNLKYLSSEQALADLAKFITNMTNVYGIKTWITFGGSYPGSLSLWAKLKYPHLIKGAFSASAPLFAKMDFFEYNEVVNRSLVTEGSQECVQSISVATMMIDRLLKTDAGRQQLQKTFNLCQPLSKVDDQYFQNSAADIIAETVQYNRDNRDFEGETGGNVTISILCSLMTNKSMGSELERYAALPSLSGQPSNRKRVFSRRLKFSRSGEECTDASYINFIDQMKDPKFDASRTWVFQTCTEFGWFQSTDSAYQPFRGFPVDLFIDMCKRIYGIEYNSGEIQRGIVETNTNYGARSISEVITNAVLFNGGVDPWHAMSYVSPSALPNVVPSRKTKELEDRQSPTFYTLFVPSSAHCAIMYPDSPKDPPALKQAREQVTKYVKEWIQ